MSIMPAETTTGRQVWVSLPAGLVEYADQEASRLKISRSQFIARALAESKMKSEARLAAKGYRFYAQKASEFAGSSAGAVAEALDHAGQARRNLLDGL
jgi:metal-responsive CopG/Arc/MetJ family transcriptional regulator